MATVHKPDPFHARREFKTASGRAALYSLPALEQAGLGGISRLPVSIRVLLESMLRNLDDRLIAEDDVKALAAWNPAERARRGV